MSSGGIDQIGSCGIFADAGAVTATSTGTTITSSGSTNTKGSYTQLIASTTRDTDYIMVYGDNTASSGTNLAVDIAVGAAASEVVVLPNLLMLDTDVVGTFFVPLHIAAGTRVSARCQSTASSDTVAVHCTLGAGDFNYRPFQAAVAYGFNSGSTSATSVDPGGVANTKGSYTQITSSTTRDHKAIILAVDRAGHAAAAARMLVDVAIGGAGSESIVIPNMTFISASTNTARPPVTAAIPVDIPAGTRIAIRLQSTNTTAGTRTIGFMVYGLS